MLIKAGVDISRLKRNARRGLAGVDEALKEWNVETVVTSTFEGNHGAGSLHYADQAFDVGLPERDKDLIIGHLKRKLGSLFDVVLEDDHIHVEYDPK